MKLTVKLLAMASAIALLAACETAKPGTGDQSGTGGMSSTNRDGTQFLPGTNVPDRVFFDYDSSVIQADGEAVLQKQAEFLKKSGKSITVEGHCDERGTREYNLALGERRAAAVKSYLVNLGVASSSIQTISYGKERPAVVGSDDAAYSANRRGVTVVNN